MRKQLQKYEMKRMSFKAKFARYGIKKGWKGRPVKTILLENIEVTKPRPEPVADHIWFQSGKQFDSLGLIEGDIISFDARVRVYIKGYKGNKETAQMEHPIESDFKLSNPTNIKKVKLDKNVKSLIALYSQADDRPE